MSIDGFLSFSMSKNTYTAFSIEKGQYRTLAARNTQEAAINDSSLEEVTLRIE
jgi:hypothetical protein